MLVAQILLLSSSSSFVGKAVRSNDGPVAYLQTLSDFGPSGLRDRVGCGSFARFIKSFTERAVCPGGGEGVNLKPKTKNLPIDDDHGFTKSRGETEKRKNGKSSRIRNDYY